MFNSVQLVTPAFPVYHNFLYSHSYSLRSLTCPISP